MSSSSLTFLFPLITIQFSAVYKTLVPDWDNKALHQLRSFSCLVKRFSPILVFQNWTAPSYNPLETQVSLPPSQFLLPTVHRAQHHIFKTIEVAPFMQKKMSSIILIPCGCKQQFCINTDSSVSNFSPSLK